MSIVYVVADELEIDFVLDVGHHDEGGNDTLALAGGHGGANLAVPYVEGRGQQRADSALGHGQGNTTGRVCDRVALRLPVDLGVVTEVLVDGLDIVQALEVVVAALADGVGYAGVEGGGHCGIASSQAEGAHTAVAVDCISQYCWRGTFGWSTYGRSRACQTGSGYSSCISGRRRSPQVLPPQRRP